VFVATLTALPPLSKDDDDDVVVVFAAAAANDGIDALCTLVKIVSTGCTQTVELAPATHPAMASTKNSLVCSCWCVCSAVICVFCVVCVQGKRRGQSCFVVTSNCIGKMLHSYYIISSLNVNTFSAER